MPSTDQLIDLTTDDDDQFAGFPQSAEIKRQKRMSPEALDVKARQMGESCSSNDICLNGSLCLNGKCSCPNGFVAKVGFIVKIKRFN